jgi:hypothetical protein
MEDESNVLPASHDLLAFEIATQIDDKMDIKPLGNGVLGDIIGRGRLEKTYEFKRVFENNKYMLVIEIVKQYAGENNGSNIRAMTEKAISRAKRKVDKTLMKNVKIDWELRAITANMTIELPKEVSLDFIKRISGTLTDISIEMKFDN